MTHDTTAANHIAEQAKASAAELIAQGWTAPASSYDLGNFHGDRDALEARLGRPTELEERRELTYAIRDELAKRALVSWRDVPLHHEDGALLTDEERARALTEYRATGGIYGVYMCDPTEYEGDDPDAAGPSVDEIDWTEFPEHGGASQGPA